MQRKSGKLEILIAAQNIGSREELPQVAKQLLTQGNPAIMINQIQNEPDFESPSKNMRVFHYAESGISRSRNRAFRHAEGDLLLITDDDVELIDGFSETIVNAFENYPEADIITFQCLNENGELRKNYSASSYTHNMRTLMKVSSVEIAVRRESLLRKPLMFDNRFGTGGPIPTGCETVFLCDALKLGYKIMYLPFPIVQHPEVSSGRVLHKNSAMIRAKGAMFYRIFGWKAYGVCILFALKKRRETGYSLIQNIQLMYSGINKFRAQDHDE